jgi:hypothetical protein
MRAGKRRPVLVGTIVEHDPAAAAGRELGQPGLSIHQREWSQILAVELEQVEGVERRVGDLLPPVQAIKDCDAVFVRINNSATVAAHFGAKLSPGECAARQ